MATSLADFVDTSKDEGSLDRYGVPPEIVANYKKHAGEPSATIAHAH
jgi:hypothetical protein